MLLHRYTLEIETTSKNEHKQDHSSFIVYLSVNDLDSKPNKMKPTEKRKF